jgi:hypothetical protein
MKNKNNIVSITIIIAAILSLITLIPFGYSNINSIEWVIKGVVFTFIIMLLTIMVYTKNKKPDFNKNILFMGEMRRQGRNYCFLS